MNTGTIQKIFARQVLDSRGNPTVEVEAHSEHAKVTAIVPSGASTGSHEAIELRDDLPEFYLGKGVLKAVSKVNEIIAPKLTGMSPFDQKAIDELLISLDGTENKSHLGANAILGVSLAVMKLGAVIKDIPLYVRVGEIAREMGIVTPPADILPTPMMNIINGGAHADSGLNIQEFMIIPTGASSFAEALRMGAETFHHLKALLKKKGQVISVGDEGGFAPRLKNNEEALDLILRAIDAAGHAGKISLGLDVASTEFYTNGMYKFAGKMQTSEDMIAYYETLVLNYPIISIEDGLAEDDWTGWAMLNKKLGKKIQLVSDDLFVTNRQRLQKGIKESVCNAILIKLNQIGTVTETMETIDLAMKHDMNCVISHRSGETEDTTIADFAVGMGTGQIKTGSLCRSERIAKYNQLLRIEDELGVRGTYKGKIA